MGVVERVKRRGPRINPCTTPVISGSGAGTVVSDVDVLRPVGEVRGNDGEIRVREVKSRGEYLSKDDRMKYLRWNTCIIASAIFWKRLDETDNNWWNNSMPCNVKSIP